MTDARVERIEPDPWLAHAFLERARTFLANGSACDSLAPESSHLLLHAAAIAACDAVLAINGRQVVGSDGGHRLRLSTTEDLLDDAPDDLFIRLDDTRLTRNEASYAAGFVPVPAVEEAAGAVTQLIELAAAALAPHLPPHLGESSDADPDQR